jgi:type II secretory pathway predicted ATPase ExeA
LIALVSCLLAAEATERGRNILLVVDAYVLDSSQLEERRPMTNSEMDSAIPFALVLLGQPGSAHGCGSAAMRPWTNGSLCVTRCR